MNGLNLIASVDADWGIGRDGRLLFNIKRDMAYFRELTRKNAVIMGRKTLDSLPEGRPLPDRVNIVMTRDKTFSREGIIVCRSVSELESVTCALKGKKIFVIGGGEIYRLLLSRCDTAHITRVNASGTADTFMVNLDENPDWILTEKSEEFLEGSLSYSFLVYKRKDYSSFGISE